MPTAKVLRPCRISAGRLGGLIQSLQRVALTGVGSKFGAVCSTSTVALRCGPMFVRKLGVPSTRRLLDKEWMDRISFRANGEAKKLENKNADYLRLWFEADGYSKES